MSLNKPRLHIVVAGNPGVGKSFILNSMIREVRFNSGVSIGQGMTNVVQREVVDGIEYADTPGLDDLNIRIRAAKEISEALSGGGLFKVIFVCTLESGRVRPSDVTTIDVILKAIEEVGVDLTWKYSVIVNKCEEDVLEALQSKEKQEIIRVMFSQRKAVQHLGFMRQISPVERMNELLVEGEEYSQFVDDAPSIYLPEKSVNVDVTSFDERKEVLTEQIDKLHKQFGRLEETISNKTLLQDTASKLIKGFGDSMKQIGGVLLLKPFLKYF